MIHHIDVSDIDKLTRLKVSDVNVALSICERCVLHEEWPRALLSISSAISELEEFRAAIVACRDKELEGGAE